MKLTVVSDTHGASHLIDEILKAESDTRHFFFLGDNDTDCENYPYLYPGVCFHILAGNCDYFSLNKSEGLDIIEGKRVFFTHGHHYGVKYGVDRLIAKAQSEKADLVLYGHTHIPLISYANGIFAVNPGSPSEPRNGKYTYAAVEINEKGIIPTIKELGND